MADNTTINHMSGGDTVASDDISGVKYQRVKIVAGADGVNDGDICEANPLPVSFDSAPLPTGAATESGNLAEIKTNTDNLNISLSDLREAIAGVGAAAKTLADIVSAIQGTLKVTLDGENVNIGNFPDTQPVSIASMPSTPVTGPLTDAQLRNSDVPVTLGGESVSVTGTFWQTTQPISATSLPLPTNAAQDGTNITSPDPAMPAGGSGILGWLSAIWTKLNATLTVTGPLTDTQLRNSDVPVTLGGESVTVSGSVTVSDGSGSITVDGPLTDSQLRNSDVPVTLGGETVGVTGTFWQTTQPISATSLPLPSNAAQDGTDITSPVPSMPAGGAGIRGWLSAIWTKLNSTLAVTGTFWQETQPVSIASMPSTAVTGPLTDAQLRNSDVKVTLDSETVGVTGPLTDAQLRNSDVPVTLGGESVTVSGEVKIDTSTGSVGVTGPLTDTQLRNSDVKVTLDSETVGVTGPLTDTQLRASEVDVCDDEVRALLSALLRISKTPAWFDPTTGFLKINLSGISSSLTLGTVTTVTGLTNVDGYQGKTLMQNNSLSAWAATSRRCIS